MALEGRVVVVIGGTTGLGLSGVLACRRAGASVLTVGLDTPSVEAARARDDAELVTLQGDARSPDLAAQAIATAIETFGRFDALYHVAGGSGRPFGDGPLHDVPDEGWAATLDLNLTSAAWSMRAAIRAFLDTGTGGSIVTLTSVLAWAPSPAHFTTHAYAAAKAGIIGLTRSCAAHYAPHDIRVNAIAPGLVDTPMSQRAAARTDIQTHVARRQALGGGRIGTPADLDGTVVYLLSDASAFVTGQVLAVDGGWSVRDASGDT
jgi:NAD(P)-dependent dehydrogenase (short-subunit alcohol dehydrogenase family)